MSTVAGVRLKEGEVDTSPVVVERYYYNGTLSVKLAAP